MNTRTAYPYAESPHDLIASDRVEGTAVYDRAGKKLGSIDHVMIDKRSGQVAYAVLEFGGFLGMGTDHYPLPWSALDYVPEQGGYVVPLDEARLKDAPHYPQGERPAYDAPYGTDREPYGRRVWGFYDTILP